MSLDPRARSSNAIIGIPSRVHVAVTYPIRDSSGLAPVIIGHESGVTIRWTADCEDKNPKIQQPSFDFSLGTNVLDIAVPLISVLSRARESSHCPKIFRDHIVAAVACSDSTVKVLLLPLSHPANHGTSDEGANGMVMTEIHHQQDISNLVSMTWTSPKSTTEDDPKRDNSGQATNSGLESSPVSLLVASSSKHSLAGLHITRVTLQIEDNEITVQRGSRTPFQKVQLPDSPLRISFSPATYPSKRHTQILVACQNGATYVYDPFQSRSAMNGLTESQSKPEEDPVKGSWLASFTTRFGSLTEESIESPYLAHRKRILDAQWAANGSAIVALLADGEWGIWDVDGSRTNKGQPQDLTSFALWGIIGSGVPSHLSKAQGPRKTLESSGFLPTMTPNTRKLKAETLFSGQTSLDGNPSIGGLVVTSVPLPSADNTEDTVTFWYNDTICFIESLQAYWSRAASRSAESKIQTMGGSLFGPGLTRIDGLDLRGQTITSIAQLPSYSDGKNSTRTIVVATEHQLIYCGRVVERGLLSGGSRNMSQPSRGTTSLPSSRLPISGMSFRNNSLGATNAAMSGNDDVFMSGALALGH